MIWIFGLMIANILIMPISYCPALNKSSILLCILGLVITLVLFQEQRKLENTGATTGAAYLDTRNTSYGFQPTAMVHSLPQVAFIWASSLFTLQGFGLVFGDLPTGILLRTLIPIAVVLVVACYGIWVALHPRERPFREFSLPESAPFLDSPTDQKDPSIVDGMV
ncbi:hypothetical protein BC826DRAFT_1004932 [Russula brevipes]|nr:hypothetical protein BC826DRAFT_1004932 [Russula brevipes]